MAISPDHAMIGGGGESPADFKVTPTLILKIRSYSTRFPTRLRTSHRIDQTYKGIARIAPAVIPTRRETIVRVDELAETIPRCLALFRSTTHRTPAPSMKVYDM